MGDPMSYDAETEAEIRKWEDKIDETTQKCTDKLSHKIPTGDLSLKPFTECVPGVAGTYKQKQKIYMANWADHKETDDKAPFCCSLQAGFVAVVDAKSMKVMKKLVKEGFVLEAAVTPLSQLGTPSQPPPSDYSPIASRAFRHAPHRSDEG